MGRLTLFLSFLCTLRCFSLSVADTTAAINPTTATTIPTTATTASKAIDIAAIPSVPSSTPTQVLVTSTSKSTGVSGKTISVTPGKLSTKITTTSPSVSSVTTNPPKLDATPVAGDNHTQPKDNVTIATTSVHPILNTMATTKSITSANTTASALNTTNSSKDLSVPTMLPEVKSSSNTTSDPGTNTTVTESAEEKQNDSTSIKPSGFTSSFSTLSTLPNILPKGDGLSQTTMKSSYSTAVSKQPSIAIPSSTSKVKLTEDAIQTTCSENNDKETQPLLKLNVNVSKICDSGVMLTSSGTSELNKIKNIMCNAVKNGFQPDTDKCSISLVYDKKTSSVLVKDVTVKSSFKSIEMFTKVKNSKNEDGTPMFSFHSPEQVDDDTLSMPLIITIICLAVGLLIIAAIYGCWHQRQTHKREQRLTEELQTMENGYHDNPTLEVMETSPEMQEKKAGLNGELGDSWIVPLDNLTREDLGEEEDTHL
ncbi:podocalyxin [Bombina bombina]|uniref:podocalyxin n=1 Tax=Bombina bombina TaxID=8345 RepID=UPI00235AF03E|nr:podocalyxin [Bombina bombina]